jgi:flagellar protein FlbD
LGQLLQRHYTTCDGWKDGTALIWLTRFDGTRFVLNSDLIETVEPTPDTVITLTNGHHFVARETVEEIVRQVIEFRGKIARGFGDQT